MDERKPREWTLLDSGLVQHINGVTQEIRIAVSRTDEMPIIGNAILLREVLPDEPEPGCVVLSADEANKIHEALLLHHESCAYGFKADEAMAILNSKLKVGK